MKKRRKRKQRPRKPKRKDIEVPQPSSPTTNVADEAVNEEMDDSRVTGARNHGANTIAQTRFENVSKLSNDPLLARGVLDDEEVFAGQDMAEKEINVVEKEVSTADLVTTAGEVVKGVVIGEQSESTTRTRPQQLPSKDKGKGIMEELKKPTKRKDQIRHDEGVAQRLQAQMQAKLKEEDRLVRQREEEVNIVSWDNVQAMIDVDYQMAQQMQAEE
ncbi:hypothetical protein Tco_0477910 [Tanacetum coccineum]